MYGAALRSCFVHLSRSSHPAPPPSISRLPRNSRRGRHLHSPSDQQTCLLCRRARKMIENDGDGSIASLVPNGRKQSRRIEVKQHPRITALHHRGSHVLPSLYRDERKTPDVPRQGFILEGSVMYKRKGKHEKRVIPLLRRTARRAASSRGHQGVHGLTARGLDAMQKYIRAQTTSRQRRACWTQRLERHTSDEWTHAK